MGGADQDLDDFLREAGDIDLVSAVADALAPVAPPPALRDRVLASIVDEGRFERFAAEVARLMDVGLDGARALLDSMTDSSRWQPGPVDAVKIFHIAGGPAVHGAVTGFVRLDAGARFPEHTHLGHETVMILQGSCEDDVSGEIHRPGDVAEALADTTHGITARPGPDLLYLAVVQEGVDIGGTVLRAGDPRI